MTTETAGRAADFIGSLGVCAHLEEPWADAYGNQANVEGEMLYLGLQRMRVVTPGVNLQAYTSLGQLGIKFDVILNNTALIYNTTTGLDVQLAEINSIAPYVSSVEGPNEVDLLPVPYHNLTGAAAAVALQQDLYAAIKADPLLPNVSVLPFSLSWFADRSQYGDLSAYADDANIHDYSAWSDPPYFSFGNILRNTTASARPTFVTETGYTTAINATGGVNESIQAKYIIDTLFEAYRDGVAQTYLYQLMDPYNDPTGSDVEQHWGLFNPDGSPKLAAVAVHNLVTILGDTGAAASIFAAGTLDYTVANLPPYSGFTALLQKSNGDFDIELWQEQRLWNGTTQTEAVVTPTAVQLTFKTAMAQVQVFDPITGTGPVATYSNVSSVSVALGSDPLVVEVTPTNPPSAPALISTAPTSTSPASTGATITGATVGGSGGTADTGAIQPTAILPTTTLQSSTAASTATNDASVYRFFDSQTGTHFYTSSAAERDAITKTRPDLVSEGVGLRALDPAQLGSDAVSVYRFFDQAHGTQFLTASASERDQVIASRPDLTFEGGNFYERLQSQAGDTPVYRYFDTHLGTHFYTDSPAERATIAQTRPDLTYEGVSFYEPA